MKSSFEKKKCAIKDIVRSDPSLYTLTWESEEQGAELQLDTRAKY